MVLAGMDHIQLAMPHGKETAARAFFGGLLGLEEVEKPEPLRSRGGCWFRGPGIALHIGVTEHFVAATKAHPAFLAVDLSALASTLSIAGNRVKWDTSLPQVRRFFTTDPFGNRLEMIQAEDMGLTERLPAQATP